MLVLFIVLLAGCVVFAIFYRVSLQMQFLISGIFSWIFGPILLVDLLRDEFSFFKEHHIFSERQLVMDDLVDGFYVRKAGDAQDMAFGMRAVLQRYAHFTSPTPDYEQSRETIYTKFSRLLVQVNGSPYVLLLAALKNMEGQPSWVPDWAAGNDHEWRSWGNVEDIIREAWVSEDMFWIGKDANTVSLLPGTQGTGLSVRARRLGTVISCSAFKETRSYYDEDEKQIHVQNLTVLLRMGVSKDHWWTFYNEVCKGLRQDHFVHWIKFYEKNRRKGPSTLLFVLLTDKSKAHAKFLLVAGRGFFSESLPACDFL